MIDKEKFEFIKTKYGHYSSWAVWAEERNNPKDKVDDISIFDIEKNELVLQKLNLNIILVGLNISRRIETPLGNFHDPRPGATDFKIRFALNNSPFWGGYMTDIIKDFEQKASGKMMTYLRENKRFEEENIETFREELSDLGVDDPTIVTFGNDAHKILKQNLENDYKVYKIPHYAKYISKENYREEVKSILGF